MDGENGNGSSSALFFAQSIGLGATGDGEAAPGGMFHNSKKKKEQGVKSKDWMCQRVKDKQSFFGRMCGPEKMPNIDNHMQDMLMRRYTR